MTPQQSVLISFSRPHRILALVLVSLFLLLVGLGIHQYSLPLLGYGEDKGSGILLGVPQDIRSDDWAAEIPLMLSQVSHKPPFPVINKNIGYGANQLAPFKLPVRNVLTVFKPTTWGFFLGANAGLAWMWWSMVLGFFYVFFLLFMLISRNRFFLSMMGSLMLLFSPFFQFWSMHKSEIPIFMALIVLSFAYLTFSASKKVILANGVLLGWSCGCFMLNFIYPPYQVSLAYLLVFMLAGFIADRHSQLALRHAGLFRLSSLAISLAIAIFAAAVFYFDAREVINMIAETVYPGKRFSTGGDFDPWKLLSNNFLIHLYLFFLHGFNASSLVNWGQMGNICEYASFIFLFPVLIPVLIARCAVARKAIDPLPVMIAAYIILIVVYMFLGFPEWLSKYSGFSRTPSFRELMGLGIANMVLLVAMLSKTTYFELSKRIRFVVITGWAMLLIVSALHLFAKWPAAPLPYLIAASLAVAFASYFLLSAGYSKTALTVLAVLSVLSTGWFNPLVRGGSESFLDSRLSRMILDIDASEGGASRWVTFSPSLTRPHILRILGVNTLDGLYPYPQFELWKRLDPHQKAVEAYNRYGYAFFVTHRSPAVAFSVITPDSFTVEIDPRLDVLSRLGVTHCLVMDQDSGIFDQSLTLQRLFSSKNSHIYKVVSPPRPEPGNFQISPNPQIDFNGYAYYHRGVTDCKLGNYGQAISDFDKAIAINPEYAEAYDNRGIAYGELGNLSQAISDFDRAVEIDPKYAEAYNGLGFAYCKLGNYMQAIADFDRAIAIYPDYARAYYNRGVVYDILGNNMQAISDFDRAIEISPDYAKAFYNRGVAHTNLSNYRQAISDFDRAIEIDPDYAKAYYKRGAAYGKLGNHSQEIEDLQKAARLDSKDAKK